MIDRVNGALPPEQPPAARVPAEQMDPATAAKLLDQLLDAMAGQVMGVTIRGLVVSNPGLPHDKLLCAIAKQVGFLLADSLAGDLVPVLAIRRKVQEAFQEGMKLAVPKPAPLNPVAGAPPLRRPA